ncbi:MAG: glycosyltransferase family 2 protein [Acidimicrobiales bacterium]
MAIGMPVRNGEVHLEAALRSLLGQTWGEFVLIVSDDGSTDRTEEIVRDYAACDERVVWDPSPHPSGANRNFNRAARLGFARSPRWFKWAAHDDLCEPRYLACCVEALERDPSVALAYAVTAYVDDEGAPLPTLLDQGWKAASSDPVERFVDVLRDEWGVFYLYGVMRADALASTSLMGPHWPADKALMAWMALLGRFVQTPEPLFVRRIHQTQSSSLSPRAQARWSSQGPARWVPSPLWATREYVKGISRSPLSAHDRRRAYVALARRYALADKWRRVVAPGPNNYFGLGAQRPAPLPPGVTGVAPAPQARIASVD